MWKWILAVGLLCVVGPLRADAGEHKEQSGKESPVIISIPFESLAVDGATTTVSVFERSASSMMSALSLCSSETQGKEGEVDNETQQAQAFCRLLERLVQQLDTPSHAFRSDEFVVTVPLKQPKHGVLAITWRSKSLDEAISFIELLQHEAIQGVTVEAGGPEPAECAACPVKDLVFNAAKMKEHRGFLKKHVQP